VSPEPTVVRSIAVTSGDVVAALELNWTSDDDATLRITPPFSARMRARLHVDRTGETGNPTGGGDGHNATGRTEGEQGEETGPRDDGEATAEFDDAELPVEGGSDGVQSVGSNHEDGSDRDGRPVGDGDEGEAVDVDRPVYIDPERLVADPPAYPRPADTREEMLSDPETTYTVERHHEYHAAAVERWRESVPDCIRDRVSLDTPAGSREVRVRTLQSDLI
jgi:hypothetical protein